jgi:hypothetical protein
MRTVLFLDFDGVLHPALPYFDETHPDSPHFQDLPALEAVLRAHPHVVVVIASTWRLTRTLATMQAQFSPDLRERVIDVTPRVADTHATGARQREIELWLDAHGGRDQPWVAVDDMRSYFNPGACLVEAHDGFRAREAALLTEALADPMAFAARYPVVPDPYALIVGAPVR